MKNSLTCVTLLLLGLLQTSSANTCSSNKQCQEQLNDPEACCLFLEKKSTHDGSFDCASSKKKTYYLQSRDYNKYLRMWINPQDESEHYQVFCHDERENKYPYVQPYAEAHDQESPRRALTNGNVYSDMFFKPKRVTGFWDQVDKWFNAFFWGVLGLPFWILLWNLMNLLIDQATLGDDPELQGVYPSMYNNFLASWIMSSQDGLEWFWPGIFKYYDMFSIQGWADWFLDFLSLLFFFAPVQFLYRLIAGDWYWLAPENDNQIDMNELFPVVPEVPDPYDFTYFMNREGPDCNGNVAVGNYCFCEDQGFFCQCQYNSDFGPGEKITTCYDYFGYDCQGNYVDGERHWCTEEGNTFTYLNQMKKEQRQQ